MAQYPKIESVDSMGSMILGVLEIQVHTDSTLVGYRNIDANYY